MLKKRSLLDEPTSTLNFGPVCIDQNFFLNFCFQDLKDRLKLRKMFLNRKIWLKLEKFGPFNEKLSFLAICIHTLPSSSSLSARKCPVGLKLYQINNFDMGFQKSNTRGRNSKMFFFSIWCFSFLRQLHLRRIHSSRWILKKLNYFTILQFYYGFKIKLQKLFSFILMYIQFVHIYMQSIFFRSFFSQR